MLNHVKQFFRMPRKPATQFDNRTHLGHLNTILVWFSDGYCIMLNYAKQTFILHLRTINNRINLTDSNDKMPMLKIKMKCLFLTMNNDYSGDPKTGRVRILNGLPCLVFEWCPVFEWLTSLDCYI